MGYLAMGLSHHAYTEYLDSTELRPNGEALRERLATEGYLLVREVLPAHAVRRVRGDLLRIAEANNWVTSNNGEPSGKANPEAACEHPDPTYRRVHQLMWSSERLHALMHNSALLQLMETLLESRVLIHPMKVLRVAFPKDSDDESPTQGWHQDFPTTQGSARTLTVWTPIQNCGVGDGVLAISPRSHQAGVVPMRLSAGPGGWEAAVTNEADVRAGRLNPGDVLIFSALTVHRATPNIGPMLRLSVDCRYQPVAEPISEYCLASTDPAYAWDRLYDGWSTTRLRRYWEGAPLRVVPYDRAFDASRASIALSAGRAGDPTAVSALRLLAKYSNSSSTRKEASALLRTLTSA